MNKNASTEVKVGIFTIIFIGLIFLALHQLGVLGKKQGQTYRLQFSRVGGITVGSSVRYAGVDIGRVTSIKIEPAPRYIWDDRAKKFIKILDKAGDPVMVDQAIVTIMITDESVFKRKLPIFTDCTEVSVSTSLMGDKWIEIRPQPGKALGANDVLLGRPPTTIEDFIAKAEDAVAKLEDTIGSVNNVLGDKATQENIKLSLENFKELTGNLKDASASAKEKIESIADKMDKVAGNINRVIDNVDGQITAIGGNMQSITGNLNRVVLDNEGDIRALVKNLVATSKSMKKTLDVVEKLVARKEFSENILATLENIKNTSEEVEGIAADIRAVTSDGQIREDLKMAVHDAREAAAGANKLINGVNNFLGIEKKGDSSVKMNKLVELDAMVEWDEKSGKAYPNLNATLLPQGKSSLKLGIDNMGYENLWNLQYRAGQGFLKPRAGIVRSKLGLGADLDFGKRFGVYLDAYDPRRVHVDATGRIVLGNDFYIHGGLRDIFEDRNPVFGAGKRF